MKGTILTRTTKTGERRYDCVWRAGGKQRWRTFDKRRDAEKFLASAVKDTHDGMYQHVRPRLVNDLLDAWLDQSLDVRLKQGLLKPSTAKSYRSMVETHLRPAFKDYRSDHLTSEVVEEWVRARADDIADGSMSPKYHNNLLSLLGTILDWARRRHQRFLAHDPLREIDLLPRTKVEREFLEPAEITKLIEAARAPDDTILMLAAFTGMRRGELFSIQWGDLDEDAGQLRVQRSLYQGAITRPKTKYSERSIDLPRPLVNRLKTYRKAFPSLDGGFIFRTAMGSPLDPDNWTKRLFPSIRRRAGLRDFGLHALRHSYASLLINQGESIKYISKQLGHASIQITADLYGHLFKETSTAAMGRLAMRIPVAAAQTEDAEDVA